MMPLMRAAAERMSSRVTSGSGASAFMDVACAPGRPIGSQHARE
jgi:hypothetical protein